MQYILTYKRINMIIYVYMYTHTKIRTRIHTHTQIYIFLRKISIEALSNSTHHFKHAATHTATHCNIQQHTAAYGITLQHTATHRGFGKKVMKRLRTFSAKVADQEEGAEKETRERRFEIYSDRESVRGNSERTRPKKRRGQESMVRVVDTMAFSGYIS